MTETSSVHADAPNTFVAENATKPKLIPMREVALLGVAGPENAMRAIIRMSNGRIATGAVGERIQLGRLLEVSPAGAVLELASGNATFLRPYPWGAEAPQG